MQNCPLLRFASVGSHWNKNVLLINTKNTKTKQNNSLPCKRGMLPLSNFCQGVFWRSYMSAQGFVQIGQCVELIVVMVFALEGRGEVCI